MIHNYYLYEKDGKLAMIPWDYNLAYGTFQGGNADSTVNTPIDAPLDNGSNADRPMWNWIVANEEYTQLYHQYFAEFLNSIDIDRIIENAYALIKDDVAKDPTAFYSYAAFELGVETLRQFCTLRSESISMQLENNETAENQDYVDASAIMLSDMGSMGGGMGGGGGDMPSMPNSNGQAPGNANNATDENPGSSTTPSSDATDGNTPPDMPSGSPGKLPDGFDASDLPEDFDPSSIPGGGDGNAPGQSSGNETEDVSVGESDTNRDDHTTHPGGGDMQMPADDVSFDPSRTGSPETNRAAWIWIAVSVGILAIGLIVAKKYKG